MADRVYAPIVRKVVVPRGGRIDSEKLSAFYDQVADDIIGLGEFLTELQSRLGQEATVRSREATDLRQRFEQAMAELEALRVANAVANTDLTYSLTLYDSVNFTFLPTSSFANRVLVDTTFGQATVPINGVQPRFYQEVVNTGAVIPIEDLSVTVTGTFDLSDGNGVRNQEEGGTVVTGEPLRAFNGNNTSRWLRKIWFPLYSDVTQVYTELTVEIPDGSGGESNVIYVNPVPAGDVDIVGVYTSQDLSDSFTPIEGFTEVEGAGPQRWIFPVRQVHRVKVRFRQRNWVEEDGKKVFYVGAQEIGLQLVEFDKTYSSSNPLNANHTVVFKKVAPDGYLFNELTSLTTDPMFTLEDSGKRHIHIKASMNSDGSSPIWDSDSDPLPQVTPVTIGSPADTIYFVVTLNYVATSGGATSPFSVGTTPVLTRLDFEAKVEAA